MNLAESLQMSRGKIWTIWTKIGSISTLQNSPFNIIFGQNLMFFNQFDVIYDQTVPKLQVSINILMKKLQVGHKMKFQKVGVNLWTKCVAPIGRIERRKRLSRIGNKNM